MIRYNTIYARNDRSNGAAGLDRGTNRYYDTIYVSSSQDVDIYGNIIRNATDDLIEADNYAVNVQISGNYLDNCLTAISHQSMQAGPAYIFRNMFDRGAAADGADYVGLTPLIGPGQRSGIEDLTGQRQCGKRHVHRPAARLS